MDHFGFICRETVEGGNCHFVCYVFQCTDESLVRHEVDKDSCLCPDTVHSIFPCNRLQITESQLRFWTLAQCHFVLLSPAVEFLQQKWCSYIFFQFWMCAEKENFTHWFFLISVPPTQCFDLISLLHLRVNKFALDLKWNARRQEGEISHKCFLFFCHFRLNISVNHRTYDSVLWAPLTHSVPSTQFWFGKKSYCMIASSALWVYCISWKNQTLVLLNISCQSSF